MNILLKNIKCQCVNALHFNRKHICHKKSISFSCMGDTVEIGVISLSIQSRAWNVFNCGPRPPNPLKTSPDRQANSKLPILTTQNCYKVGTSTQLWQLYGFDIYCIEPLFQDCGTASCGQTSASAISSKSLPSKSLMPSFCLPKRAT